MIVDNLEQIAAWGFVYLAMPLAWASVLLHARTPWRRTEVGRHLLVYAVVIAVILSFSTIRYFTTSLPEWFEVARALTYMTLIPVMAWRIAIQLRAARNSESVG